MRRLNSVLLPTLGRPTMATRGFISVVSQLLEAFGALAPARLHPDAQVQVHMRAQQALHGLARVRANRLQHLPLFSDDDGLLAVALHEDGGGDADESAQLARRSARPGLALGLVEDVHH